MSHQHSDDTYDVRAELLSDFDVPDAAVHYAREGMLSTSDLWWLYEEHRIMAPATAWLFAAWEERELDESLVDQILTHPGWWEWFDPWS